MQGDIFHARSLSGKARAPQAFRDDQTHTKTMLRGRAALNRRHDGWIVARENNDETRTLFSFSPNGLMLIPIERA
jgi:hypothetical protein